MVMLYWLLFLPVWILLWPDVADATDVPFFVQANFVTFSSALLLCITPELFNVDGIPGAFTAMAKAAPDAIERTRKSVYQIMREFGPIYGRAQSLPDE